MAHYYDIRISDNPKNNEQDKAESIEFLTLHYDDNQHLIGVTANGITRDNKSQIYDKFPGLHTLVDVLPYMPQDISESESLPFHLPTHIDLEKTYQQRYDTDKREYFIKEL